MLLPRLQPYHTLPCNCRPNQSMTHNTIPYPILSQQYNENLDIILYNVLYLLWRIDTIPYCTIPCLRLRDILTHTPDIHRYVIANVELKEGLRLRNIPGFRAVFLRNLGFERSSGLKGWLWDCESWRDHCLLACSPPPLTNAWDRGWQAVQCWCNTPANVPLCCTTYQAQYSAP